MDRGLAGQTDERVGGDDAGLQVRERPDAVVLPGVRGRLLLDGEGDEEPELGDEAGHGLDVDAVEAVLDQVELPSEVRVAIRPEGLVDTGEILPPGCVIARFEERVPRPVAGAAPLLRHPERVVRVKPAED